VVEEHILAHHPREETMSLQTDTHPDTYPANPPIAVAVVPRRRRKSTFVALGMAALLAFGAGVGAAALVDDGSGPVAHPSTAVASATSTTDADTLWSYLATLPAAERDHVLVALIHDPTGALRAVVAGMVAAAG
jgi:hypothetical protein